MENTKRQPQRALIVGLGIAGMATALRLHGLGWDVTLIEKAPDRRRGGYFIALFGTGIAAAERLGIGAAIHDRTVRDGHAFNIDRKGGRKRGLSYSDLPGEARWVVRGDIEDAAFNALPDDVTIRYSSIPLALRQDPSGVDVDISDQQTGVVSTERFDLVVGADGLRSTVRKLVFGPRDPLHRLGYMIATFSLDQAVPGFRQEDALMLAEDGRSVWVFSFADRPATVLFSYRTDDVDGEFKQPPIQSLRKAYGPQPTGETLGWLLDQFEKAPDFLFDSAEQVHSDRWYDGRVMLIGDAAWCMTLYSGMGASTGLAGADLLGTMLEEKAGDIPRALAAWQDHLRPFIAYHVKTGINQRRFFTPGNSFERWMQSGLVRLSQAPITGKLLYNLKKNGKDAKMKGLDIAGIAA